MPVVRRYGPVHASFGSSALGTPQVTYRRVDDSTLLAWTVTASGSATGFAIVAHVAHVNTDGSVSVGSNTSLSGVLPSGAFDIGVSNVVDNVFFVKWPNSTDVFGDPTSYRYRQVTITGLGFTLGPISSPFVLGGSPMYLNPNLIVWCSAGHGNSIRPWNPVTNTWLGATFTVPLASGSPGIGVLNPGFPLDATSFVMNDWGSGYPDANNGGAGAYAIRKVTYDGVSSFSTTTPVLTGISPSGGAVFGPCLFPRADGKFVAASGATSWEVLTLTGVDSSHGSQAVPANDSGSYTVGALSGDGSVGIARIGGPDPWLFGGTVWRFFDAVSGEWLRGPPLVLPGEYYGQIFDSAFVGVPGQRILAVGPPAGGPEYDLYYSVFEADPTAGDPNYSRMLVSFGPSNVKAMITEVDIVGTVDSSNPDRVVNDIQSAAGSVLIEPSANEPFSGAVFEWWTSKPVPFTEQSVWVWGPGEEFALAGVHGFYPYTADESTSSAAMDNAVIEQTINVADHQQWSFRWAGFVGVIDIVPVPVVPCTPANPGGSLAIGSPSQPVAIAIDTTEHVSTGPAGSLSLSERDPLCPPGPGLDIGSGQTRAHALHRPPAGE